MVTGANAGLDRREAVRALLADRGDLLVVTGLGSPAYDANAAGDTDANFYLWGAMGGAAMTGLGLALAQPSRPVLVLTGDGEALMGMGALATIAVQAPGNLTVAVLDNGHFGETGGQASHASQGVDLAGIAAASGFAWSARADTMAEVEALRPRLREGGPGFAHVLIAPGSPPRSLPPRDGVHLKTRFRAALGFGVS